MLADDVAVSLAPSRTYARLVEGPEAVSWRHALERPVLVLLVIGVASAIATTGRVTAGLVVNTMLVWSFVIVVQMAAGAAIVTTAPLRRVSVPRAMDLLFAGHLPWSLWACAIAVWAALDARFLGEFTVASALIAIVWNAAILANFNRAVLGTSGRATWARTLSHQGLIWLFGLNYIAWMSGGWFRLLP